jgi:hypothetical protein
MEFPPTAGASEQDPATRGKWRRGEGHSLPVEQPFFEDPPAGKVTVFSGVHNPVDSLTPPWRYPGPENLFRDEALKVRHRIPDSVGGQGYPD